MAGKNPVDTAAGALKPPTTTPWLSLPVGESVL